MNIATALYRPTAACLSRLVLRPGRCDRILGTKGIPFGDRPLKLERCRED